MTVPAGRPSVQDGAAPGRATGGPARPPARVGATRPRAVLDRDCHAARRAALVLVVLGLAEPSPAARAQEGAPPVPGAADEVAPAAERGDPRLREAQDRILRGERLFDAGDPAGALVEFRRAETLLEGHTIRYLVYFNVGRSLEALHLYDDALAAYRRYLAEGGRAEDDAEAVASRIEVLDGLLGTLVVSVEPVEAELWVDDRRLGPAPGTYRIEPGRHAVELRARGHLSAARDVEVASGERARLDVVLEPVPEEYGGLPRGYFWTAVAATAATAAAGVVVGTLAGVESRDVESACDDDPDGAQCRRADAEARERIERRALVADVLFGSALVFAVGSVVLGLATDWGGADGHDGDVNDDARGRSAPDLGAWAGPSGGGLTLRQRF